MNRNTLAVVLIMVAALLVLGAAAPDRSESGRWQIVLVPGVTPTAGGDNLVLLLNTVTGETHPLVRDRSDQPPYWAEPLQIKHGGPSATPVK